MSEEVPVQLQPFAVLSKSGGTRHKCGLVFVLVKLLHLKKKNDVTRAVPLTFSSALISGRVVEREAQWNQGSNLQDDESDILQGLPYQLQEGFWLLWRYQVFPIYFFSFVQVRLNACKTCKWYKVKSLERKHEITNIYYKNPRKYKMYYSAYTICNPIVNINSWNNTSKFERFAVHSVL